MSSLTEHEIAAVTHAVNARVIRNILVQSQVQPIQDALASGALAFFGDRYGSEVRTVSINGEGDGAPFSHELCGGTHVHATGEVGFIYVVGESSVGAGMRRVEAVAGSSADDLLLRDRMSVLERLSRQLTVPVDEIEARIADQMAEADPPASPHRGTRTRASPLPDPDTFATDNNCGRSANHAAFGACIGHHIGGVAAGHCRQDPQRARFGNRGARRGY